MLDNELNDESFQAICDLAVRRGLTVVLARQIGVARTTVGRWASGIAKPLPIMRKHIVKIIWEWL